MTAATSITVRVPLAIRHRPGRKTVVRSAQEGVPAVATRADPALVKALARAFRYQRLLGKGQFASISEIATAGKIERGRLSTLLWLTLLAPEHVVALLSERAPADLALPRPGPEPLAAGRADGHDRVARASITSNIPGVRVAAAVSASARTCRRRGPAST